MNIRTISSNNRPQFSTVLGEPGNWLGEVLSEMPIDLCALGQSNCESHGHPVSSRWKANHSGAVRVADALSRRFAVQLIQRVKELRT